MARMISLTDGSQAAPKVGDKYKVSIVGCVGECVVTITEVCEHHGWHAKDDKGWTFKGDDLIFKEKAE